MKLTTKQLKEIIKEEVRLSKKQLEKTMTLPRTSYLEPQTDTEKKYFSREKRQAEQMQVKIDWLKQYYPNIYKTITLKGFKRLMLDFAKNNQGELPSSPGEFLKIIDTYLSGR